MALSRLATARRAQQRSFHPERIRLNVRRRRKMARSVHRTEVFSGRLCHIGKIEQGLILLRASGAVREIDLVLLGEIRELHSELSKPVRQFQPVRDSECSSQLPQSDCDILRL